MRRRVAHPLQYQRSATAEKFRRSEGQTESLARGLVSDVRFAPYSRETHARRKQSRSSVFKKSSGASDAAAFSSILLRRRGWRNFVCANAGVTQCDRKR